MPEVKFKVEYREENSDSDDVRFYVDGVEKGFGFLPKGDAVIALMRCPLCERENYMMNVLSGQCTWCGFNTKSASKYGRFNTDRYI